MNLYEYFENTKGVGILATADADGKVDAAIYARPHIMEDESIAFIMRDRLSHANLQSNPHAVYIFMEDTSGYKGKRLFLIKTREEQNIELINELSRRSYSSDKEDSKESRFLVFFKLEKELPLIGSEKK
jgi:hypothetical protein